MAGIKTNIDRASTWQGVLLAVASLVLVLVMTGQGLAEAAGVEMSAAHRAHVSDSAEVSHEHDHHRSHGHDVAAQVDTESGATDDRAAHHAGHADGGGCCPASACGSACSGVCSGLGVGVPVTATLPPPIGALLAVGVMTDDPVLARPPGVPFRPPILRRLAAG